MKLKKQLIFTAIFAALVSISSAVTTFYGNGETVYWTNSGSAVASGDIVSVGIATIGVPPADIAASASGTVGVEGVYLFAKDSTVTYNQGARLFWDGDETTTVLTSANIFIGYAQQAATSGQTKAYVKIRPYVEEGERYLALTASTTLSVYDFYSMNLTLLVTATTATITLPAVASLPVGCKLTVKKAGSAGAITIDGNASEQVEGGATYTTIDAANDVCSFVNTGSAWILTARYIQ